MTVVTPCSMLHDHVLASRVREVLQHCRHPDAQASMPFAAKACSINHQRDSLIDANDISHEVMRVGKVDLERMLEDRACLLMKSGAANMTWQIPINVLFHVIDQIHTPTSPSRDSTTPELLFMCLI